VICLTINQFLEINPTELSKMNQEDLEPVVREMAKKANKRLEKLSWLEIPAPAFHSRQVYDKKGENKLRDFTGQWVYNEFTSEGKNLNQLRNEAKYMQMFFKNKTSTVTGANRNTKSMMSRILETPMSKIDLSSLSYDDTKAFWEGYNKAVESNIGILSAKGHTIRDRLDSNSIQTMLYNMYKDSDFRMTSDDLYQAAQKYIDDDYKSRTR